MAGVSGRFGVNFGNLGGRASKGRPNPWNGAGGGPASDHGTLIALVVAEALFVGWLRFSFSKRFGG